VAQETENSFTPRLGLEYRLSRDILFYATYAKGFKSGGFNNNAFGAPLQPEKLTDYEGGIKAEFLDHRLRTNLAAFYYDYSNLQLQKIIGSAAIPLNAGKAIVKGVEAEVAVRPLPHLELSANGSFLDTKIKNFSTADAARPALGVIVIDGNRLPQSPRYTINVAAAYTIVSAVGDFTLRGEAAWTDRVFFSFYNRPEVSQPAYGKYNAFLNYANERTGVSASVFIRNIANKRTISSAQVSAGFSRFPIVGAYDPPRTYGASLGYSF
jgi:iron complex outermembrane receptor protein